MRKKILVTLLTIALSASMLGCGSSHDSSTDGGSYAVEDTVDTSVLEPAVPGVDVYEEPTMPGDTEESSVVETYVVDGSNATDIPDDDPGFGRPPEEDCIDYGGSEEVAEVNNVEDIEGIIVAQETWDNVSSIYYTIYAIDPVTGASRMLNQFAYRDINKFDSDYIRTPAGSSPGFRLFGNFSDIFSSDYTKAAVTKTFVGNGESHAGWLDANGNFFDVTIALGEQAQSDFDALVRYCAVGFQNDIFIYASIDDRNRVQHYYGVAVDDIAPGASWEISASDRMIATDYDTWHWLMSYYRPTCWLDDDRVLVERIENGGNKAKCRIATVSTRAIEQYLPGEDTNNNWNAVASPDGTKVAFFSQRVGGEDINIYTASISGDNPTKLEPDFNLSFAPGSKAMPISNGDFCYILEWR